MGPRVRELNRCTKKECVIPKEACAIMQKQKGEERVRFRIIQRPRRHPGVGQLSSPDTSSSGMVNDMGDSGGYSPPSATASNCENGGSDVRLSEGRSTELKEDDWTKHNDTRISIRTYV